MGVPGQIPRKAIGICCHMPWHFRGAGERMGGGFTSYRLPHELIRPVMPAKENFESMKKLAFFSNDFFLTFDLNHLFMRFSLWYAWDRTLLSVLTCLRKGGCGFVNSRASSKPSSRAADCLEGNTRIAMWPRAYRFVSYTLIIYGHQEVQVIWLHYKASRI